MTTYKLSAVFNASLSNIVNLQVLRAGRIKSVRWTFGIANANSFSTGSTAHVELSTQSAGQIGVTNTSNVISERKATYVKDNVATIALAALSDVNTQEMVDFPVGNRDILYINTNLLGNVDQYYVTCFVDVMD